MIEIQVVPVGDSRDALLELRNRYDDLVMDRFHAMCAGRQFRDLRKAWLKRRRIRKPFVRMEEWIAEQSRWRAEDSRSWEVLQRDVAKLSEEYGIAPWQVLWALFIKEFTPRSSGSEADVDLRDPNNEGHLNPHFFLFVPVLI